MTAEQFFCIAMIVFVFLFTILTMVAAGLENKRLIQIAIADIREQVDNAYGAYEVAQRRHDRYQTTETEEAERLARNEYRRWRAVLDHQLQIATKAGVQC